MSDVVTLYGAPHSLYTGKARSYLIKSGIPYKELSMGHESFKSDVLPKAKLATLPTILTADGQVIRDGAAIIEHFESNSGRQNQPKSARQQVISALFDVIGTEGLLRPAMHYRWNFPDDNLSFLHYHFYHSQRLSPTREEKTERMMDRMRSVGQIWGVNDDTKPLVESLYVEFLAALNTHLERYPYLLGGRPCVGDFGLMASLYAHLGRDPYPARLMQQQAVNVYRWVERMNHADQDAPEFFDAGTDFLSDDEVPNTLIAVLKVIAQDFMPETIAAADVINQWLADNQPDVGETAERMLGPIKVEIQGQPVASVAQPYRFYLLQRIHDVCQGIAVNERQSIESLLEQCNMSELLTAKIDRKIQQVDNLEVWQ